MGKLVGSARDREIQKVRRLIGSNYSDVEICAETGMDARRLTALKRDILDLDSNIFEEIDSASIFSDYLMKVQEGIRDLNKLIKTTNIRKASGGEKAAYVAAIKLRGDFHDRCIKLGQELGHIGKRARAIDISLDGKVDFNFKGLSDKDLKEEIAKEVKDLNNLATGNVIDMRPELLGITNADIVKFLPGPDSGAQKNKAPRKAKNKARLRKIV